MVRGRSLNVLPVAPRLRRFLRWSSAAPAVSLSGWFYEIDTSEECGSPQYAAFPAKQVALPTPGEIVDARLLKERTKKGGWKAMHEPSGLCGAIQNSGDVPAAKNVGETLRLIVAIANEREIAFRYAIPADEGRAQRPPSKVKGHGGSGRSGRRI